MKIFKYYLIFLIFWIIFINIFSSYSIKYSSLSNENLNSNENIVVAQSVSLEVKVKRSKFLGILPTYIYFYYPVISNGFLYFKIGEIRIFEITIFFIILLPIIFLIEKYLKAKRNILYGYKI